MSRLSSDFVLESDLVELWTQYTTTNNEIYFRNFVESFVDSWKQQICPSWEMLPLCCGSDSIQLILPPQLLDELLTALAKFVYLALYVSPNNLPSNQLTYTRDIVYILIIICQQIDNIPLVASTNFVSHLTEMYGKSLSEPHYPCNSIHTEICHFLQCIYDPYFHWINFLCGQNFAIYDESDHNRSMCPIALHSVIVPFLYDSIHTALSDDVACVDLLMVYGAIICGNRYNAIRVICPASIKMIAKITAVENRHHSVYIRAIYCCVASIKVLLQVPKHECQLDPFVVLEVYRDLLLSLSHTRPICLGTLNDAVNILVYNFTDHIDLISDSNILETFLVILSDNELESDDDKSVLISFLIESIRMLFKKCGCNCPIRQTMVKINGFEQLLTVISNLESRFSIPSLRWLLYMSTAKNNLSVIQQIHPIVCVIQSISNIKGEDLVELLVDILKLCSSNISNVMKCCEAHVISLIIPIIEVNTRQISQPLWRLLEILASHSLSRNDLKIILQSDKLCAPIMTSLAHLTRLKTNFLKRCSSYFNFSTLCFTHLDTNGRGLSVEVGKSYSFVGLSFHCWLRLDRVLFDSLCRRQIFHAVSDENTGVGVEAFINDALLLVVSVYDRNEYRAVPLESIPLTYEQWYCIDICLTPPKGPFRPLSQVSMYINGLKQLDCSLRCCIPSLLTHFSIGWPLRNQSTVLPCSNSKSATLLETFKMGSNTIFNFPKLFKGPAVGECHDDCMKWTLKGLENVEWGRPFHLGGQMAEIHCYNEAMSEREVYILFQSEHSLSEWRNRLVFCYSASVGNICSDFVDDLSNSVPLLIARCGVSRCITYRMPDVINAFGGLSILIRLLDIHITNSACEKINSEHLEWWNEDLNPIAELLMCILDMVSGHQINLEHLYNQNGCAFIGLLLQRVHPNSLLDTNVFMTVQNMVETSTLQNWPKKLCKKMYSDIVCDFRIWSRAELHVQIAFLQYLRTLISKTPAYFRKFFDVQFFMDVLRTFYCSEFICRPLMSMTDVKIIRESILQIVEFYLFKCASSRDISSIMTFMLTVERVESIVEVAQLMSRYVSNGGGMGNKRLNVFYNSEFSRFLYCLLLEKNVQWKPTHLRLQFMENLLLLAVPIARKSPLNGGCCEGFLYELLHESSQVKKISVEQINCLLDLLETSQSTTKDLVNISGILELCNHLSVASIHVKIVVVKRILDLISSWPDVVDRISQQMAWQTSLLSLLVKKVVVPILNDDWADATDDVISIDEPISLDDIDGQVSEVKSLNGSQNLSGFNEDGDGLMFKRSLDIDDEDNDDIIEDINNLSIVGCIQIQESCEDEEEVEDVIVGCDVVEDETDASLESDLCEIVLAVIFAVNQSYSGVQERGQVISAINMLGISNDLYRSHVDLKRRIIELSLQSALCDLRNGGVFCLVLIEGVIMWTYDLVILDTYECFARKVSDDILNALIGLLKCIWEKLEGNIQTRENLTKMSFEILFRCIEHDNKLGLVAATNLHAFLRVRTMPGTREECGYLIYHLDCCLRQDEIDRCSYLLPLLKTVLEGSRTQLGLCSQIPGLNMAKGDGGFIDVFPSYIYTEEWTYYIDKKAKPLYLQYLSGYISQLSLEMNTFWAECYELVKISIHRRNSLICASKSKFHRHFGERFEIARRNENVRFNKSAVYRNKGGSNYVYNQWLKLRGSLEGPRGVWNSSHKLDSEKWMLASNENQYRMKLKLIRNLKFKSHRSARDLNDQVVACNNFELDKQLLEQHKLKLRSSDLSEIETEEIIFVEGEEEEKIQHGEEKLIFTFDCQFVTYMSVINGKFELTNKFVYFSGAKKTSISLSLKRICNLCLRRFNLRKSGLEFFMLDNTNYFFNFDSNNIRNRVLFRLLRIKLPNLIDPNKCTLSPMRAFAVSDQTQKWITGQISNFAYLMHLNTIAGRSCNDLSQYPVFPWILSNYTSTYLDLTDPSNFRDLSKPVGVQNPRNVSEVRSKYDTFEDPLGIVSKFHYGTHYSNSATILHYLVRVEPFASLHVDLQGGRFDVADRQFHSIGHTWNGIYNNGANDVKELIPEFFYFPEFLINSNRFDLGHMQSSLQQQIDDVILPPWAENADDFIRKHRQALESDYVSEHLNHWIDLIFGYKQKGHAAVNALNVFYYCSYEGAVNLDGITDVVEREALEGMINNFGQTPSQLLMSPHPQRIPSSDRIVLIESIKILAKLSLKETICFLSFSNKSSGLPSFLSFSDDLFVWMDTAFNVGFVNKENSTFKILSSYQTEASKNVFAISKDGHFLYVGGHYSCALQIYNLNTNKITPVGNVTASHVDVITCVAMDIGSNGEFLITGSRDTTSVVWQLSNEGCPSKPAVLNILYGHDAPIYCVAVSSQLDVAVTGSLDNTINMYNANEGSFLRTLQFVGKLIDINITYMGYVAICCSQSDGLSNLSVYTINGRLLTCVVDDKNRVTECVSVSDNLIMAISTPSEKGCIVRRDAHTLEIIERITISTTSPVTAMCAYCSMHVLVATADGTLSLIYFS